MVENLQHKSKFNCQKLIQMVTVDFYLIPFLFRDGLSWVKRFARRPIHLRFIVRIVKTIVHLQERMNR